MIYGSTPTGFEGSNQESISLVDRTALARLAVRAIDLLIQHSSDSWYVKGRFRNLAPTGRPDIIEEGGRGHSSQEKKDP